MIILWVNTQVQSLPSWNPFFGTTWLRFSSRARFLTWAHNPVGPQPVHYFCSMLLKTSSCSSMIFSASYIENPYRLWRGWYLYVYVYTPSSWHHILMISAAVHIEIYRVGDNRGTVNTLKTQHISDQLGTKKNVCKILLRWFIIMIWFLVCNNMYRYERHFGFFLSQSNNFRDSKWVNTENFFFIEIQQQGIILASMCLC